MRLPSRRKTRKRIVAQPTKNNATVWAAGEIVSDATRVFMTPARCHKPRVLTIGQPGMAHRSGLRYALCPLYFDRSGCQLSVVQKILVIDDDAKMRKHMSVLLASEGYQTIEARNGREGVEMIKRDQPDLVLCDITMPEMNGHRVLESVRADSAMAHLPFIFLTGWGEKEDLRTGMNLGADDYLVKPIEPAELLTAVKARLRRRQQSGSGRSSTVADATPEALATTLGLTPREAELLSWVVQGKTNPEIGIILGIQLTTVKKHLESIFAKLGVENRTAAVTLALEKIGQRL